MERVRGFRGSEMKWITVDWRMDETDASGCQRHEPRPRCSTSIHVLCALPLYDHTLFLTQLKIESEIGHNSVRRAPLSLYYAVLCSFSDGSYSIAPLNKPPLALASTSRQMPETAKVSLTSQNGGCRRCAHQSSFVLKNDDK